MGNLEHVKLDRDMRIAIVLGSSKADGNTHQFAEAVAAVSGGRVFDLSDYDITYYDYKHQNESDDFLELMRTLVDADHIVWASPVYWYSMSAQMKVVFDRLSDLTENDKLLGRRWAGKSMSVISTGYQSTCPSCFIEPFVMTARYFDLDFRGHQYLSIQTEADLTHIESAAQKAAAHINGQQIREKDVSVQ
jgi:multimeric flavodoxin WrbA